jgi:tetratricopeptide (TPR) repeat protein
MTQPTSPSIDARYNTLSNVGRDQITYYIGRDAASDRESLSALRSLAFNDAPIDLLSSHFTGREDELDHIGRIFSVGHDSAPTRLVIFGMPGLGKTQLILRHAILSYNREQYSSVFWISGATLEKLNQGFAKVLTLVGHPDRDHLEQNTRLTSARRWLEESNASGSSKWLLILDNVTQEAVPFLKEHLPRKNSSGNILFTTRTEAVAEAVAAVAGQQHHLFELRAPELEDAVKLLLKEARSDASNSLCPPTAGAEALVKCVGRLPLAISQAASFARQSHQSLENVLRIYQSKHKHEVCFKSKFLSILHAYSSLVDLGKLISWDNNLSNYEQKSIAATFAAQLEELKCQSPDFSNLLTVLSFFDPESIPLHMLTDGAEELQSQSASGSNSSGTITVNDSAHIASSKLEALIVLICSPVQLQRAIRQLQHLSLVGYESNSDTSVLRIHDLIQSAIQESAQREEMHYGWFHVAAALACNAFRHVEDPSSSRCWAQCEMISPHIHSLTKWDDEHGAGNSGLDQVNIRIAKYLRSRGRYSEAEMLYKQVLKGREKLLGLEHRDTLRTVEGLAITHQEQGRYGEAEKLYGRALAGFVKLLGPDHPDTLLQVENIAVVYCKQGRYTEAEAQYGWALAGKEKLLGPNHLDTLGTVNNLAIVHDLQKRYNTAETLYERVLEGREQLLGPEDPDTLATVNNLAIVYRQQRRYKEAETMFRRALEGNEKLLGPEHPDNLQTMNNLANNYHSQGLYNEAETLYRRALTGNEKVLGPEHPNTLNIARNLANTYNAQGRHAEAETLYRRVLAGREKVLGPKHPATLRTVRRLSKLCRKRNRHEEAVLLQNKFPLAFEAQ